MKIQRIKPPKYRVGKFVLNEYELRQLLLDVASRTIILDKELKVIDMQTKDIAYVDQQSNLSDTLPSLATLTNMKFDRIRKANS